MVLMVTKMDQITYPGPPLLFHVRMNTLFVLLWVVDLVMFAFAVESTLNHGVNGMVLFASEVCAQHFLTVSQFTFPRTQYAILMASALNSMARYILSVIDYRRARARGGENAPPMENKSMYIFYIELFTGLYRCVSIAKSSGLMFSRRLLEADHLPHFLHVDHDLLRAPTEHHPRRLSYRPFLHHSRASSRALPQRHPGYGSSVPRRNGSGAVRDVRSDVHHLSRRDVYPQCPAPAWRGKCRGSGARLCRGSQHDGEEAALRPHIPFPVPAFLVGAPTKLPDVVSLLYFDLCASPLSSPDTFFIAVVRFWKPMTKIKRKVKHQGARAELVLLLRKLVPFHRQARRQRGSPWAG